MHDNKRTVKDDKETPATMTQRFFHACLLVFGGIILICIALSLLAKIWVWLVVAGLVVIGVIVLVRIVRARQDRW